MFALQNAPRSGCELPGLQADAGAARQAAAAKFDLTLTLRETSGRLVGGFEYATRSVRRGDDRALCAVI